MHANRYGEQWADLSDKVYQRALEVMRAIHPIKEPIRGVLGTSDVAFSRRL